MFISDTAILCSRTDYSSDVKKKKKCLKSNPQLSHKGWQLYWLNHLRPLILFLKQDPISGEIIEKAWQQMTVDIQKEQHKVNPFTMKILVEALTLVLWLIDFYSILLLHNQRTTTTTSIHDSTTEREVQLVIDMPSTRSQLQQR